MHATERPGRLPRAEPVAVGDCAAWLHLPARVRARDCGVVLCGPFAAATVNEQRKWRALAVMFAQAGFPALRLDYPGTGNSAEPAGPGYVGAWAHSIGKAADWLREHTGVREMALCGLQFGALLAAAHAATAPGGVRHLLLLAPTPSGKGFLREARIAARLNGLALQQGLPEAQGLRLTAADARELETLNLIDSLDAAAARILILYRPGQRMLTEKLGTLAGKSDLSMLPFTQFDQLAGPSHVTATPRRDFAAILRWLRQGTRPRTAPLLARPPAAPWPALPGCTERPLRFGPADGLFGVLAEPAARPPGMDPSLAVLFLNTGANVHLGNSRIMVLAARQLAQAGIAALRMDVRGLGESAVEVEAQHIEESLPALTRVYRAEFREDVTAGLDALEALGYTQCIVMGICSGANLALHVGLSDARVLGLLLANATFLERLPAPPTLLHRAQRAARLRLGAAAWRGSRAIRRVLPVKTLARGKMFGWARALHEQVRVSVIGATRLAVPPLPPGRIITWLEQLAARGVEMRFIFSEDDEGLSEWRQQFEQAPAHLAALGHAPVIIPGLSHAFETIEMRDALIELMANYAMEQAGLPPPGAKIPAPAHPIDLAPPSLPAP